MKPKAILKNKKAMEKPLLGGNIVFYAAVILVLGIQAALFGFTSANYYVVNTAAPRDVQENLRIERPLVSPDCFAYQDPNTQRIYPYHVDLSRFNSKTFQKCLKAKTECYAMDIYTIVEDEYHAAPIITEIDMPSYTKLVSRVVSEDFAKCEKRDVDVNAYPVVVIDNNNTYPAMLKAYAIT